MYWYHYNYTVPFWMLISFQCFVQYIILKISKFSSISSTWLPAVRPGCASVTASVFSHKKGNHDGFTVPKNTYPLCHGASFYLLLVSFHHQIVYRKVRKVSINLLHHTKFITSLKVSHLCNQHSYWCTCCQSCTTKQIDLQALLLL